jgi:hypothetical protein
MRQSVLFFSILLYCSSAISEEQLNPKLLSTFYDLWKDSAFGQDPNRTERAVWILQSSAGSFECKRWPASSERNKEFWHGPMPQKTIAQAHTHTVKTDPKPSWKDIQLSRRIGLPLYTISGSGIWMATPDGKITQLADSKWYRKLQN